MTMINTRVGTTMIAAQIHMLLIASMMLFGFAVCAQSESATTDPRQTLQGYTDAIGKPAKNFWLKVRTDQDCLVKVDDVDKGTARVGQVLNIYLAKGAHRIEATCTNCGSPSFTGDYQVDKVGLQTFYDISFGPFSLPGH